MPATTVGGSVVGVEYLVAFLALPVGVGLAWYLVVRGRGAARRRTRWALLAARVVVVVLLVGAAAQPYVVSAQETPGDPHVTLLVDRSGSTRVTDNVTDDLVRDVEAAGVPVEQTTVATGTESRVGDAVAANLAANGTLVLVSDGRVTDGRSLSAAATAAREANVTLHAVRLPGVRPEAHVSVEAPATSARGAENRIAVRVGGTGPAARLTVTVDGETALDETVEPGRTVSLSRRFNETGEHRVVATFDAADVIDENDVSRATVSVVEPPSLLYVAGGEYPLGDRLAERYDLTRADRIPANLSQYYGVVVQDLAAADLGNVSALYRFVVEGNGAVVVGGPHAYDQGNYTQRGVGTLLPVQVGNRTGQTSNVVIAVDVSGSARQGMRVQQALALDVLDQLGDSNRVGVVAFNDDAYRIADIRPLGDHRADVERNVRRLQGGGQTDVAAGLYGAAQMLGQGGGTVILLSDGRDDAAPTERAAAALGDRGIRVVSVAVGAADESLLQRVAALSGGTYFRADETNRLRVLFGGPDRRYEGEGLAVVDGSHFITRGARLTADPARTNQVSVKPGASFLVADDGGRPAIAAWQFGLGRVVSVTAYDPDGSLDGLLDEPDSAVLARGVNWAVGDPGRKATGVTSLPDTRVGESTTVVYRGQRPPAVEGLRFQPTEPGRYEATVTPSSAGFHDVLNATYAADYPAEYAAFGRSDALDRAVAATGGRLFDASEGAAIAAAAADSARQVRETRTDLAPYLLVAALAVFVSEVLVRRILVVRGVAPTGGGLP
ncbi:MAG: VWA domain-containing protein [Halobacteriaceae archaeon]